MSKKTEVKKGQIYLYDKTHFVIVLSGIREGENMDGELVNFYDCVSITNFNISSSSEWYFPDSDFVLIA